MQDFIFFVGVIAIAIGFLFAKLYQAVYAWIDTGVFDFYGAGMTAMGGFIGGAAAFLLIYFVGGKFYFKRKDAKLHVREFNKIFLTAPICITTAHAFGRLGCLMAGCCHGELLSKTEYVFGGIWMRAADTGVWGYYVPTQLYEALFLFALFGVLTYLYFHRSNILMHIYLIAYGVWRIFIEFFRTDYVGGSADAFFRPSQVTSLIFIGMGLVLFLVYYMLRIPYVLPDDD